MKKELTRLFGQLEADLARTNKHSSNFFKLIKEKLQSLEEKKELSAFLNDLKKIGSISQYGDFTPEQDRLLEEILKEVNKIRQKDL